MKLCVSISTGLREYGKIPSALVSQLSSSFRLFPFLPKAKDYCSYSMSEAGAGQGRGRSGDGGQLEHDRHRRRPSPESSGSPLGQEGDAPTNRSSMLRPNQDMQHGELQRTQQLN